MLKRIYIEITNRCNLNCAFCKDTTKDKQDISLDNFEYILKEIKDITNYIYLHIHGEPLLHPNFKEILNISDKYNMHIQLVTNATLLNKYPDILKNKSLRKLSLSLQSIEYSNIDIDELFKNIFRLIDEIKEYDDKYLELRFWRSDQYSLDKTKKALDIIDKHFNIKITNRNNSYELAKNSYLSLENMFDWPILNNKKDDNGTCLGLINQIGILVDGTVVPCCLDVNGDIALGNIYKDKLISIINSDKANIIKKGFKEKILIEDLCKSCTYRNRFG